jgi:quinol-cytochrome oxidoreductase complex cytochrome b subunit
MIKNLSMQDLRNRGLALLDERVRIITAGLGLKELRAVLRGDPATEKPNPRYRVHTTSFVFHIRPRYYQKASTWFTHTFRLGYLSTLFFIIEIITGLILMVYYVPSPAEAYQSILELQNEIPFGSLLRDLHRLGAEAMVAFVALHMLRTYLTGSYKKERSFTWLTGVFLLLITLFLSFSGYLLPWDQLAYWAVTIGTSMADSAPLLGNEVNLLLRGAQDIGAGGLLRFYLLHVVLVPLLGIVVLSVHYYKVGREHSISLPARVEEGDLPDAVKKDATQRIDFIPDLLTHEIFLACLVTFALVVMCVFFYNAPLEHHADPQKTPLDTKAPWYFLWIQGLLKLGDPALMGIIIPTLVFAVLFAVPYIDRNPYRMMSKRPIAVVLGLLFVVGVMVLTYMGTPQFGIETPPAVRIIQDMAPEEGVGPLRTIPFEQLEPGVYEVGTTDPITLPPQLALVFIEFEQRVQEAEEAGQLPDAQAVMVIEDWQADLKKVTPRIIWTDPESGEQKTFDKHIFLHRTRGSGGE